MKIACPNCGADVAYSANSNFVYCLHCNTFSNVNILVEDNEYSFNEGDYSQYNCSTCGAKLVTSKTDIITRCVYCNSEQIIKDRISNDFKPDYIVPFKVSKEKFVNSFNQFIKRKSFASSKFKDEFDIIDIKGLYVPFYLVKFRLRNSLAGYVLTEADDIGPKKWFAYQGKNEIIQLIDTSVRLDDDIISSLFPYNIKDAVCFEPGYLTGFQAECMDESENNIIRKIEDKALYYSMKNTPNFKRLKKGYFISNIDNISMLKYILLPIWFVKTKYKKKDFYYAMNGQTGKIRGEIPINNLKLILAQVGAIGFAILLTALLLYINSIFQNGIHIYDKMDFSKYIVAILTPIWVGAIFAFAFIRRDYKNLGSYYDVPYIFNEYKEYKKMYYENEVEFQKEFKNYNVKAKYLLYKEDKLEREFNSKRFKKNINKIKTTTINNDIR